LVADHRGDNTDTGFLNPFQLAGQVNRLAPAGHVRATSSPSHSLASGHAGLLRRMIPAFGTGRERAHTHRPNLVDHVSAM